ncbi:MAG: TonB-dependent receptor [Flavipsychrobacter sp.]|nr:TonB-dependent receptor [Flavipsychrobacter sp.]
MQKSLSVFIVLLLVVTTKIYAQQIALNGTVNDAQGKPVVAATVSLLNTDSTWVQSELTDDNGAFVLHVAKTGNYIVAVNAAGFTKLMQQVDVKEKNETLKLQLIANTTLQDVVVSSKSPRIETGLGKTVVNLDQVNTLGNSAWDLLRKSPGVNANNGNITLQGVGVTVLIDDKQTYLAGKDLEDYLKSMTGDNVAALELITQPSGKYDAEGAGGIINIKTKNIKKKGLNGNVALEAGQGVYPNTHNSSNLTYRNNKLTLYTNLGQMAATGFLNRKDTRKASNQETGELISVTDQSIFMKETFGDYNAKLGADCAVTEKTKVGASAKGIYHPNVQRDEANAAVTDAMGNVVYNTTVNNHTFERNHYLCNVYIKHEPAKGHEITADADYIYRDQRETHYTVGRNYDVQGNHAGGNLDLDNQSQSVINVVTAKADYSGEVAKGWEAEAGVKSSYVVVDNGAYFHTLNNGNWINDTTRTNHFIYKENINAAYVNVSKAFGKKWDTQVGVRVENMNNDGKETQQGGAFQRSNTSVFPTAFVSYKIDDNNSVEASCGRRINRPAYTMMSPFITYFSQYYYQKGNPDLSPAYRNYLELRYNNRNELFVSIGLRKVTGYITPILGYDANNKAVFATWGNYADDYVLHGSCNYNKQCAKWLLLTTSADVYYNKFLSYRGNRLLGTSIGASGHFQATFNLNRGWTADTTFYASTGDLQNVIDRYDPSYWLGFNVAKKVMKEAATIRLSIEDPFRMNGITSSSKWNGIETASSLRFGSQSVELGFSYNFGRKMEGVQQHNNKTEEAGRM